MRSIRSLGAFSILVIAGFLPAPADAQTAMLSPTTQIQTAIPYIMPATPGPMTGMIQAVSQLPVVTSAGPSAAALAMEARLRLKLADALSLYSRLMCFSIDGGSLTNATLPPSENIITLMTLLTEILNTDDPSPDRNIHRDSINLVLSLSSHCQMRSNSTYRTYSGLLVLGLRRAVDRLPLLAVLGDRKNYLRLGVAQIIQRIPNFAGPHGDLPTDERQAPLLNTLASAIVELDRLDDMDLQLLYAEAPALGSVIDNRFVQQISSIFGNYCNFTNEAAWSAYRYGWSGYRTLYSGLTSTPIRQKFIRRFNLSIEDIAAIVNTAVEANWSLAHICALRENPTLQTPADIQTDFPRAESLVNEYFHRVVTVIEDSVLLRPVSLTTFELATLLTSLSVPESFIHTTQRGNLRFSSETALELFLEHAPRLYTSARSHTVNGSAIRTAVMGSLVRTYSQLNSAIENTRQQPVNPLAINLAFYRRRYADMIIDLLVTLGDGELAGLTNVLDRLPTGNEYLLERLLDALLPDGANPPGSLSSAQHALLALLNAALRTGGNANSQQIATIREILLSLTNQADIAYVARILGSAVSATRLEYDPEVYMKLVPLLEADLRSTVVGGMAGLSAYNENLCSALSAEENSLIAYNYFAYFRMSVDDPDYRLPQKLMRTCNLIRIAHIDAIQNGIYSFLRQTGLEGRGIEVFRVLSQSDEMLRAVSIVFPSTARNENERNREEVSRELFRRTIQGILTPDQNFLHNIAIFASLTPLQESPSARDPEDWWPAQRFNIDSLQTQTQDLTSDDRNFVIEMGQTLPHLKYMVGRWFPPLPRNAPEDENRRISNELGDELSRHSIVFETVEDILPLVEFRLRRF